MAADSWLQDMYAPLLKRGVIGIAWADADMVVRGRQGDLAEFLELNRPLAAQAGPFIGLASELRTLQQGDGSSFSIPEIALMGARHAIRFSADIVWDSASERYFITLFRSGGRARVAAELISAIRSRRVTEERFSLASDAVVECHNLLNLISAEAPLAMVLADLDGSVVYATQFWCDLFAGGQPVLGLPIVARVPALQQRFPAWLKRSLAGEDIRIERDRLELQTSLPARMQAIHWHVRPWLVASGSHGGLVVTAELVAEAAPRASGFAEDRRKLTPREFEIVALVANGHANKSVAYQLGISEKTVEVHRASAMRKLGIKNFAELVRFAVQAGIGEPAQMPG